MRWIAFQSGPLECSGLPWLDGDLPDLWRPPRLVEGEALLSPDDSNGDSGMDEQGGECDSPKE